MTSNERHVILSLLEAAVRELREICCTPVLTSTYAHLLNVQARIREAHEMLEQIPVVQ